MSTSAVMTKPEHEPEHEPPRWSRYGDRSCAHCGRRTFKMSHRVGNELVVEPVRGPQGNHTFTGWGGPGGPLFAVCTGCLTKHFGNDRQAVLAWARTRLPF